MWIPRSPAQIQKWRSSAAREAQINGLIYGGGCFLGITLLLAGGCASGANAGLLAQDSVIGGSFLSRMLIFAMIGAPVAFWLYRTESNKHLQHANRLTICPQCEATREGNADMACDCGGTFVLQSSVYWKEDEPNKS